MPTERHALCVLQVGVSGLTLGGGKGYLIRQHGLLSDRLVGLDYIDQEGNLQTANSQTNSDVYWLARGAGGQSFPGLVLRFRFEAVPMPSQVTKFKVGFSHEVSAATLTRFQEHVVFNQDTKMWARWEMFGDKYATIEGVYTGPKEAAKETFLKAMFCWNEVDNDSSFCPDVGNDKTAKDVTFDEMTWWEMIKANGAAPGVTDEQISSIPMNCDECYGSGKEAKNRFKARSLVFQSVRTLTLVAPDLPARASPSPRHARLHAPSLVQHGAQYH